MSASDHSHSLDKQAIAGLLQEKSIQPTQQRLEIARVLFARPQHMCADEVLAAVNREGSLVSKATVYNTLRSLTERGARLTVLPATTGADEILALGVDGVVLSNGPGDPEPLEEPVSTIRDLLEREVPMLGICLGHQLLGLALGAKTYKMKFGHHGGNQPVKDLDTGRTLITSQNHGFAVEPGSLPAGCRVTQRNLNDGSVEAFDVEGRPVVSVQYHPEAAPGPREAATVFDHFLDRVVGSG